MSPRFTPRMGWEDEDLVERLIEQKPRYILVNIGGGVQEKLGYYLKKRLEYQSGYYLYGSGDCLLERATGSHITLDGSDDPGLAGAVFDGTVQIHSALLEGTAPVLVDPEVSGEESNHGFEKTADVP